MDNAADNGDYAALDNTSYATLGEPAVDTSYAAVEPATGTCVLSVARLPTPRHRATSILP